MICEGFIYSNVNFLKISLSCIFGQYVLFVDPERVGGGDVDTDKLIVWNQFLSSELCCICGRNTENSLQNTIWSFLLCGICLVMTWEFFFEILLSLPILKISFYTWNYFFRSDAFHGPLDLYITVLLIIKVMILLFYFYRIFCRLCCHLISC